jgi:spore germination cell wall hydrolase CwlJ-like protein
MRREANTARDERRCLAQAIYFEARGEPPGGQAAVAGVILARTRDERYPSSICRVVYQNAQRRNACQFSFACDGVRDSIMEPRAWQRAKRIANHVLGGRWPLHHIRGATHYHATYVSPGWAPKMKRLAKIGRHVFYRG